jgi:periplasmic protein TonB
MRGARRMRMTLSLLAATALHGVVFGVAAAVLSHAPAKVVPAPVVLEVEVLPAKPDPIAETSAASAMAGSSPQVEPAAVRPHTARRSRQVALVGSPTAALADSAAVADAPAAPAVAPSASSLPAAGAVRASAPAAPSGGAPLSAKARYRSNPKPDYPIPSLRRREEGIVLVNVQVAADGTPVAVSLNRSCGHPLLDRSALDAIRRSTFEPARAAGVPVSSLLVQPVRFSLDDR